MLTYILFLFVSRVFVKGQDPDGMGLTGHTHPHRDPRLPSIISEGEIGGSTNTLAETKAGEGLVAPGSDSQSGGGPSAGAPAGAPIAAGPETPAGFVSGSEALAGGTSGGGGFGGGAISGGAISGATTNTMRGLSDPLGVSRGIVGGRGVRMGAMGGSGSPPYLGGTGISGTSADMRLGGTNRGMFRNGLSDTGMVSGGTMAGAGATGGLSLRGTARPTIISDRRLAPSGGAPVSLSGGSGTVGSMRGPFYDATGRLIAEPSFGLVDTSGLQRTGGGMTAGTGRVMDGGVLSGDARGFAAPISGISRGSLRPGLSPAGAGGITAPGVASGGMTAPGFISGGMTAPGFTPGGMTAGGMMSGGTPAGGLTSGSLAGRVTDRRGLGPVFEVGAPGLLRTELPAGAGVFRGGATGLSMNGLDPLTGRPTAGTPLTGTPLIGAAPTGMSLTGSPIVGGRIGAFEGGAIRYIPGMVPVGATGIVRADGLAGGAVRTLDRGFVSGAGGMLSAGRGTTGIIPSGLSGAIYTTGGATALPDGVVMRGANASSAAGTSGSVRTMSGVSGVGLTGGLPVALPGVDMRGSGGVLYDRRAIGAVPGLVAPGSVVSFDPRYRYILPSSGPAILPGPTTYPAGGLRYIDRYPFYGPGNSFFVSVYFHIIETFFPGLFYRR